MMNSRREETRGSQRLLAKSILACCVHSARALTLAAAASAASAAPVDWNLRSQALADSLRELAQRAGLSLQVQPGLRIAGRAPAVQGPLELQEALQRLLEGSALTATVSAGTLIVTPAAPGGQRIEILGTRPSLDVADRVLRGQASDVRDLFTANASTDIGGGTRNGQRLYLRGVEGSQLNITIDGARQGANLYNHRGGLNNIDPEIVKRVELNPGPPGADEGYGALGGSVRFETIDAQDRLRPGQAFGGLAKLGGATASRLERGSAGGWARLGESLGLVAYFSEARYGDLRTGGGQRVPFSGGVERSQLLKASWLDVAGHSLRMGFEDNKADGLNYMQRGDYPWQIQPTFATRPPQDQSLTRRATTLRWDYNPGSRWVNLRASLADSDTEFFAPNSNSERFTSKVRNGELRNEVRLDLGALSSRTTVGIDRFEDRGASDILNRPSTRSGTRNTGFFVQSRLNADRWGLEAGARQDRWSTSFVSRSAQGSATSLNLQGEVEAGPGLTLFGGVGEAARGYSTIPLQFTRNIVASGLLFNGSATGTLRSETARLSEVGMRWRKLHAGLRMALEAKAYDNRVRDGILYRQPGTGGLGGRPVTEFFNYGQVVRFHGMEVNGDLAWAGHASRLSLARPKVAQLPPDPQFIARYGAPTGGKLVWDHRWQASPGLTLGYTLTAVRRLGVVPNNQVVFIPRAGYVLHDLQVLWRPLDEHDLTLALAANNLGDRRYSSQLTFTERGLATEEAGRNLRLTATWMF